MKQVDPAAKATWRMSLPVRGAWIETRPSKKALKHDASLPVRGAWIETLYIDFYELSIPSRSL